MNEDYYVNLAEASDILRSRSQYRNDVESYWSRKGIYFPHLLKTNTQNAMLARQLSTFRFEDAVFMQMAETANLHPIWSPFSEDKFSVCSSLKRSYVQPLLANKFDKHGNVIVTRNYLIKQLGNQGGLLLKDMITENGTKVPDGVNIMDWHQKRWLAGTNGLASELEASSFKGSWGTDSYVGFLSLFIAHAVLFEDYHGGESGTELNGFTKRVFEPAFKQVENLFGVKPLLVRLPWWKELAYYPDDTWLPNWRERPIPGQ